MPNPRTDFWQGYAEQLVSAGILAPQGYGKGLPVLLPWGLELLRGLVRLFARAFELDPAPPWHVPSALCPAAAYDREVEAFGGYDNVFRLRLDGAEYVVRPDSAVANLRHALGRLAGRDAISSLAVFQGMRRLKGLTPPLFRDCSIWPFVQLNHIAAAAARERVLEWLHAALLRFFESLCLRVELVRAGSWKNYSPDFYYAVLTRADGTPTIVAMTFEVGESYRRLSGVAPGQVAFDVGLTQKCLGALLLARPEALALPSSLAPVHAVIVGPGAALDTGALRVHQLDAWPPGGWRAWAKRGVPVLIERAGARLRLHSRSAGWRAWQPEREPLAEVVAREDAALRADPPARGEDALFRTLCSACTPTKGTTGPVVPEQPGACTICGRAGRRTFVFAQAALY